MNNKTKITVLLTSIALGLGISAQFYTNHKIDQGLQHFPYHLKDRVTLDVVEKKRNFFKREFIFVLKDEEHQTDIITTQLTALPFAITAESKMPTALVQQLNKKLNITIDKNTINSQFSVVGDYLQSQILTEFRDLTNKAQQLEIHINYASKTQSMEIQSELSGFNYDAKTKLEGLKGQYVLTPIGEHQYDITDLALSLKQADIFLLNGENTHIKLENARYDFDKTLSAQHYDSALTFHSERLTLSNKYKKSPQENIVMTQFDATLQQRAVPNQVSFYQEVEKFIDTPPSLSDAVLTLMHLLRHNDEIKSKIAFKELLIPQQDKPFIQLKDLQVAFHVDQKNKKDAEIMFEWHLGEAKGYPNTESTKAMQEVVQLNTLNAKHTITQVDLEKRLAFMPFYANLLNPKEKVTPEDRLAFQQALHQLAEGFKEKNHNQLKLNAFHYGDLFTLNGLEIDYQQTPTDDQQYHLLWKAFFNKLQYTKQHLELTQFKLNLPFSVHHHPDVFLAYVCWSNHHYQALCAQYFTPEKRTSLVDAAWPHLALNLKEGHLHLQLDTLPNTQANTLNVDLNLQLDTSHLADRSLSPGLFNQLRLDSHINLDKGFFHPNEQANKARANSTFWSMLTKTLPHPLLSYFHQSGDNYHSHVQIQAGQVQVNGKSLAEIQEQQQQAEAPSLVAPEANPSMAAPLEAPQAPPPTDKPTE